MKEKIKRVALDEGAAAAGVASFERLGGLPSMVPHYLLPGTRSIISLALPLDGTVIRRYLGKENHEGLQHHETEIYRKLHTVGLKIASFLESEGYKALVPEPNLDYRWKNTKAAQQIPDPVKQRVMDWSVSRSGRLVTALKRIIANRTYYRSVAAVDWKLTPSFSHRYGAVAAGLGSFGWSGNVMHPDHGARVLYHTVLTDAPMESDPMIEDTPCDGCRTCVKVCQAGYMSPKEKDTVTIGNKTFTHTRKGHNLRCILVCGGFVGQHKYKGWSTWSPGRMTLPDTDHDIVQFWNNFALRNLPQHNYFSKTLSDINYHNQYGFIRKPGERFRTTCGNCQFVCWKDRKDRKENYNILVNSGEVVEGPNFSFQVVRK